MKPFYLGEFSEGTVGQEDEDSDLYFHEQSINCRYVDGTTHHDKIVIYGTNAKRLRKQAKKIVKMLNKNFPNEKCDEMTPEYDSTTTVF